MSRYIRLRGLPWSVTHQEILDFLAGVNVANGTKGIHLVTNRWDGKNTGEAFIELESEKDEEEAFKHNKETLGHRYIEIFSASTEEAEHAIRKPGSPSNVVKLRGLPYSVTEEDIEKFFSGLEIKPDREGILIVMDRRGRATGEAYVQFETQDDTEQALKHNREKIGHRYIEIFRSSVAEMRRQSSGNRPGPYDKKDRGGSRGGSRNDFGGRGGRNINSRGAGNFGASNMGGGGFNNSRGRFNNGSSGGFGSSNTGGGNGNGNGGFGDFNNFGNNRNNNFNGNGGPFDGPFNSNRNGNIGGNNNAGVSNFGNNSFGNGGMNDNFRSNNMGGGGNNSFGPIGGGRNENDLFCIHMRGLPYYSFENDVIKFFEPIRPITVKIIFNNKGLHSGSADAYFDTHEDAMQAMKKQREQMGSRYIELFFDGKHKGNPRRI